MPPDNTWKNVTHVKPNSDWEGDGVSLLKKLKWNGELLPNTHGSRMKILQWIMKEWAKSCKWAMDSVSGREFINDEEWVIEKISHCDFYEPREVLMDDSQRRRANHLFKKYGGNRKGMDFTKVGKVYPK